jgi:hypothetical protein
VELVKALYGTLKAARLSFLLLSGKLQEWGFDINGYDSCVANKTINDKQCTILPQWIHLDVVGRLTPSKDGNQEFIKRTHRNTPT